ncbi:MAG: class D sortase [Ruminococcus sp.]|nr:class D sortase [Ruminococcus sp.]
MKKKTSVVGWIALPILITVFCSAVICLCAIRPAEKVQTYLKVGFMDNNTVIPKSDGIEGLTIVKTDIDTEYSGKTYSEGEVPYPEYGTQYAVLECEKNGIFVPVYWGIGSELLELGGCNTPSSMPAGADGNTVISAHVNTFFHDLDELKKGDKLTVYTDYGRFTYSVRETIEFASGDKTYLRKSEDNILTLYTCEKELLGEAKKRIGVICDLEKKEFYKEAEHE